MLKKRGLGGNKYNNYDCACGGWDKAYEWIGQRIAERMRGQPYEGLILEDFQNRVPCYCQACEAEYRRDTGRPGFPTVVYATPHYEDYVAFDPVLIEWDRKRLVGHVKTLAGALGKEGKKLAIAGPCRWLLSPEAARIVDHVMSYTYYSGTCNYPSVMKGHDLYSPLPHCPCFGHKAKNLGVWGRAPRKCCGPVAQMSLSTGETFPRAHSIRHLQHQLNPDSSDAYTRTGWRIIARNTATSQTEDLGFIPADAPENRLENIPLADGVYEIEARPSDLFWQDCHCRKLLTLKVGDGGTEVTGLPVIQNLRREISPLNFQPALKWNIAAEYAPADMSFAIWFSDTTPVDITGQPDITINYFDGHGEYQTNYTQTAECYVTVAAITDTEVGRVSELHLPWSTIPPVSPPNQLAVHSQVGESFK